MSRPRLSSDSHEEGNTNGKFDSGLNCLAQGFGEHRPQSEQ